MGSTKNGNLRRPWASNPTNSFGDDVIPLLPGGHELKTLNCAGPYRSAADEAKL